jgi:hypothetical protein
MSSYIDMTAATIGIPYDSQLHLWPRPVRQPDHGPDHWDHFAWHSVCPPHTVVLPFKANVLNLFNQHAFVQY